MFDIKSIIQHYIQGTATPEEQEILYKWIQEDPQNKKTFFLQKDVWDASQINSPGLNDIEKQEWFRLHRRLFHTGANRFSFNGVLKYAAVIILAIGAGWLGHSMYSSDLFNSGESHIKQVQSHHGQIKEIFLADGTHVWLNSGSSLSFPSHFDADNREVELSGEAFFEVNANEKKPFLVKTKNHTVKVTGTRFNINEYPDSKIVETTLEEGKVKIISGNVIRDLYPGQTSSFNTATAQIRISDADLDVYTSWKDGLYEFNNESISRVFKIIERWWDVKIDYPVEKLGDERITGTLRKHKPLEQHFEVINQLVPFTYSLEGDLVKVTYN